MAKKRPKSPKTAKAGLKVNLEFENLENGIGPPTLKTLKIGGGGTGHQPRIRKGVVICNIIGMANVVFS